ncbi:MAG: hypothetical protein CL459_02280 [Acidimicrobiaceae bacterium]|nr:hypothetical protein [Acidimicrobiaceae bacterium]
MVRHKTLAMHPMGVEEAADEMDQLDHGFFLYLDDDRDLDRVVYRNGDGGLHVLPTVAGEDLPGDTRPPVLPSTQVMSHLPLEEAEALLDETDDPFVFFAFPGSDRGQVLYRRFDDHYGLITPACRRGPAGRRSDSEPGVPVGEGSADLVGAVLLDEVRAGHGDLGLVGPGPAELPLGAGEDRPRLGIHEELRDG